MAACRELQTRVFGDAFDPRMFEHLLHCHARTVILGYYDAARLVGCNGFLAHAVRRGDEKALAYQSCISATDPEYRGRGIFQSLIDAAKSELMARGAAFLFGFPNETSEPIFVKKLDFQRIGRNMVVMPTLVTWASIPMAWSAGPLDIASPSHRDVVAFDVPATAQWKSASPAGSVHIIRDGASMLFGRTVAIRILGRETRLFMIGGYDAPDRTALARLLSGVNDRTGAFIAGCNVPSDAPLAVTSRLPLRDNKLAPLIVHPLGWRLDGASFNAWDGLLDVY